MINFGGRFRSVPPNSDWWTYPVVPGPWPPYRNLLSSNIKISKNLQNKILQVQTPFVGRKYAINIQNNLSRTTCGVATHINKFASLSILFYSINVGRKRTLLFNFVKTIIIILFLNNITSHLPRYSANNIYSNNLFGNIQLRISIII